MNKHCYAAIRTSSESDQILISSRAFSLEVFHEKVANALSVALDSLPSDKDRFTWTFIGCLTSSIFNDAPDSVQPCRIIRKGFYAEGFCKGRDHNQLIEIRLPNSVFIRDLFTDEVLVGFSIENFINLPFLNGV